MQITATFILTADVEGWAQARKCTTEQAEAEIFRYLGSVMDPMLDGQTYLTLDSAAVIES